MIHSFKPVAGGRYMGRLEADSSSLSLNSSSTPGLPAANIFDFTEVPEAPAPPQAPPSSSDGEAAAEITVFL